MARDDALKMAGALLALALIPALWPMSATAAPEERDAICQGYRGTALWGECTRAVDNGCDEWAHLRCERWAQQWREQTGAEPPWLLKCGFGSKCVFVTSAGYTGDLVAEANSLLGTSFNGAQGLEAGDALCQHHAGSEGSLAAPGTYKAWLSNSFGSPASGFTRATVPYRRVDGTEIATDWGDLTSGSLAVPIDRDEHRARTPSPFVVWTNTTPGGTPASEHETCLDWTFVAGGSDEGGKGDASQTDGRWTQNGADGCHDENRLYCFQQ